MKQSNKSKKKGGDSMKKTSVPVKQAEKARRGRMPKEDRSNVVLPNGLYAWQWQWIQKEAQGKVPPVDAAWYQRFMVQTFIDAVESSRADIKELVTPELDKQFETLIKQQNKE